MQRIKNQVLAPLQEAQKPIVYDAYFKNDGKAKAVVIFCHTLMAPSVSPAPEHR